MRTLVAVAIVLGGAAAQASATDVFVPAHRTRDGSYVPANVPPNSSGAYLARRPGKGHAPVRIRSKATQPAMVPPLLAEAEPIRR